MWENLPLYPNNVPELFSNIKSDLISTCFNLTGPWDGDGEVWFIREMCAILAPS